MSDGKADGAFSTLYLRSFSIDDRIPPEEYYSDLPIIRQIQKDGGFTFTSPITFFVGENGIGKSSVIEALAINAGFNPEGGTLNFSFSTRDSHSSLYEIPLCMNISGWPEGSERIRTVFFSVRKASTMLLLTWTKRQNMQAFTILMLLTAGSHSTASPTVKAFSLSPYTAFPERGCSFWMNPKLLYLLWGSSS